MHSMDRRTGTDAVMSSIKSASMETSPRLDLSSQYGVKDESGRTAWEVQEIEALTGDYCGEPGSWSPLLEVRYVCDAGDAKAASIFRDAAYNAPHGQYWELYC